MISFDRGVCFPQKFSRDSRAEAGFIFLTGATGMLGASFLRRLLIQGRRVAVLVRPSHGNSGRKRIDSLLSYWENKEARELSRPVVIEGDLSGKGWAKEQLGWFAQNVDTVVHCAASLAYYGDEDAEPYATNLKGFRTILDLCERARIRNFHHVSTAYVAGSKRHFLETDCNVGQKFRNDYEKSKILAEEAARNFGFDSLTVYRPSIVVGDSRSGYSATFSGIYAVLKMVHTLVCRLPLGATSARFALKAVGMNGSETKNLVPIDWVAEVFSHIFSHEEFHGKTYHLTNPKPLRSKEIAQTIQTVVERYALAPIQEKTETNQCDEKWFSGNLVGQMKLFRDYLGLDPQFDSKNTQEVAPHLPCPEVNAELLRFLFHCAIESRFGKRWDRLELV